MFFLVQELQYDSDTQIAQYTCLIEELRSKINDVETEHRDKVSNIVKLVHTYIFYVPSVACKEHKTRCRFVWKTNDIYLRALYPEKWFFSYLQQSRQLFLGCLDLFLI